MADEVKDLQTTWQGDKVAEIYLQGLGKIGGYIRSKGAYAHPNSIKLLLTFYYNFEKIVSTQDISSEEITQLLAGDVRKFRILQYQINQSEDESTPSFDERTAISSPSAVATSVPAESDHTKPLRAAILSLDWEVTDENLKLFNTRLAPFHQSFANNKPALVLIQGLQALGDYISEKRGQAHPESFILLHSFSEALDQLAAAGQQPFESEKVQSILTDRINRLNHLKMLIVNPNTPLDEQRLEEMVGEINAPVAIEKITDLPPKAIEELPIAPAAAFELEAPAQKVKTDRADEFLTDTLQAEIDTLFSMDSKPAMETADVQYPDEILSPDAITPVDDELADDFIEAHLSNRGLMPALSDTDEFSGFNEESEPLDLPAQSDLAEQLDFLFDEASDSNSLLPDSTGLFSAVGDREQPSAALADIFREDDQVEAALTGFEKPTDAIELSLEDFETAQSSLDIQGKLDNFFAEALDESAETETLSERSSATGGPLIEEEEIGIASALADVFPEEETVEAALADAEVPRDTIEIGREDFQTDQSALDIQSKLDSFFAESPEDFIKAETISELSVQEIENSIFFDEENGIAPALADSGEQRGFSEEEAIATLDYTPMEEIEEKLDFFFGTEVDVEPVVMADQHIDFTAVGSLAETADQIFEEVQEEPSVTPALSEFLASEDAVEQKTWPATPESLLDNELEGALSSFFDAEEDVQETTTTMAPTELAQMLEAAVDESALTAAITPTWLPKALVSQESSQVLLASLGALLPGVVRATSRENVAKSDQLLAALQNTKLSSDQQALLQLLHAVISMLARLPKKDAAATEKLVNYLYQQTLEAQCPPEILPEAINRFTVWLQNAFAIMPTLPTQTGAEREPHFEYSAKELYFELTELRGHINEEFAKLRHEMHHKH
ncbi:MAG: hypothetical protein JZU50_09780 [Desulfobulbaceae bacterium]|nr:hypothetical protein [Desulfobulbaceae bacterium]